mmetsp:Transcript_20789/g.57782  ORF Transcript_20789/g.57782 Transcript_20789/m.57782 type:complete len:111 (+) Transcript_20789:525-857(+)
MDSCVRAVPVRGPVICANMDNDEESSTAAATLDDALGVALDLGLGSSQTTLPSAVMRATLEMRFFGRRAEGLNREPYGGVETFRSLGDNVLKVQRRRYQQLSSGYFDLHC